MYRVTSKKSGEVVFCDSREEAEGFVRLFAYINNKQHYRCDNKNNYIIEEIWPILDYHHILELLFQDMYENLKAIEEKF